MYSFSVVMAQIALVHLRLQVPLDGVDVEEPPTNSTPEVDAHDASYVIEQGVARLIRGNRLARALADILERCGEHAPDDRMTAAAVVEALESLPSA